MHLTKRVLDAATYEGSGSSRCVLWDDDVKGFGLRVYPTGRKSFVLSYRTNGGRKRLMTLGAYGVMTLTQARQMARTKLVEVNQGEDPVGQRREASEALTFRELADAYLERHAKVNKKSWREDERYIKNDLTPKLGALKAREVTRADISTMHTRKGKDAPYAANRALEVAQSMFAWGEREGVLPPGHPNPAANIKAFKEKRRERFVQPDELPALAEAIAKVRNPYTRAVIWLYLLTGARKNELLSARWENVDLEARTMHFPETKNGRAHTVPLSHQAVAILEDLPRQLDNPHVFCSPLPGRHLRTIQNAWERARKRAGLEDVRLHDLRRTVGSWMAMEGVPLLVIGKTLNHTSHSSTMVYARLNHDPVRTALDAHGARLMALASGEDPEADAGGEVIQLEDHKGAS